MLENNQNFENMLNTVPELVPVLNWVELRTNVFGSEQKSLRAWRCSKSDVRKDDGGEKEDKQQEEGTDEAKDGKQDHKGKVSRHTDRLTYLPPQISDSSSQYSCKY